MANLLHIDERHEYNFHVNRLTVSTCWDSAYQYTYGRVDNYTCSLPPHAVLHSKYLYFRPLRCPQYLPALEVPAVLVSPWGACSTCRPLRCLQYLLALEVPAVLSKHGWLCVHQLDKRITEIVPIYIICNKLIHFWLFVNSTTSVRYWAQYITVNCVWNEWSRKQQMKNVFWSYVLVCPPTWERQQRQCSWQEVVCMWQGPKSTTRWERAGREQWLWGDTSFSVLCLS